MLKQTYLAVFLLSSSLFGLTPEKTEEKPQLHHFSPFGFYRVHREGDYRYNFTGIGVRYDYKRDHGLHCGTQFATNLESDTPYIEHETYLGVELPWEQVPVMPKIMTRYATHQIKKEADRRILVQKGTVYAGFCFLEDMFSALRVGIETHLYRDLYTTVIWEEVDHFTGVKFKNPFGIRASVNFCYQPTKDVYVDLKGTYSEAIDDTTWEAGVNLAICWLF